MEWETRTTEWFHNQWGYRKLSICISIELETSSDEKDSAGPKIRNESRVPYEDGTNATIQLLCQSDILPRFICNFQNLMRFIKYTWKKNTDPATPKGRGIVSNQRFI